MYRVTHPAFAIAGSVALSCLLLSSAPASAANDCTALQQATGSDLTIWKQLKDALGNAVPGENPVGNGGFDLPMWGTIVARDGKVCAVAFSGDDTGDQWPGSRVISAQKANTANSFSLPGLALSTANLWAATQPGGSLFGLQESNPIDTSVAYAGDFNDFGTRNDPMVTKRIGGLNVFGGGLALYKGGILLGGLGVSGDSSCADHNVAWRVRDLLKLNSVPGGVGSPADNIIYDVKSAERGPAPGNNTISASGFGHPECGGTEPAVNAEIVAGFGS